MDIKHLKDFYSTLISNWLSGGELVNRNNLSALDIKPLYDRIVTRSYIKKVICISKVDIDCRQEILKALNSVAFQVDRKCKVYTNTYALPSMEGINVNHDMFKKHMAQAEDKVNQYKDMYDSLSGTEKTVGKKIGLGGGKHLFINKKRLKRLEEEYSSYKYVYDTLASGGSLSNAYFFIELIAPDNKIMKELRKEVGVYLSDNEFVYRDLSANSSNYMFNYSPASYIREFTDKEFSDILLSHENLAFLNPVKTHGFIGDGRGFLLGFDRGSHTPFILNFFNSGDRQINVYIAPSGEGKTIAAFQQAISALDQNFHVSVLDVKGDEWNKLFRLNMKGIEIDFSEESRTWVNTLRLDDLKPRNIEEARQFYTMAVSATCNLFRIVCNIQDVAKMNIVNSLIKTAVTKTFSTNGIEPKYIESFKKSKYLKYEDVIKNLTTFSKQKSHEKDEDLILEMVKTLTTKFKIDSTFKGREVSLNDVLESPLVIYSLNKNDNTNVSNDDVIRSFMISYLDMKKISYRKSLGQGTVAFYEEIQRKEEFKNLLMFIRAIVTGARSSNVVVNLLCNSISTFESEDLRPVTSNISTYFIGPIENKHDYEILENMSCEDIVPLVKMMSKEENRKRFKNSFVAKYNTGTEVGHTIMKAVFTDEVMEKLNTRDRINTASSNGKRLD